MCVCVEKQIRYRVIIASAFEQALSVKRALYKFGIIIIIIIIIIIRNIQHKDYWKRKGVAI